MSREWKPGDVVVAEHPFLGRDVRGIIDTDGAFYTTDQSVKGISSSAFALANLRPLVVIDPEDRDQVERLAASLDRHSGFENRWNEVRSALIEFANPTPPKPNEPTGLGAVVEDADGRRWVRARDALNQWRTPDEEGSSDYRRYAEVSAVRVLSEGVTA